MAADSLQNAMHCMLDTFSSNNAGTVRLYNMLPLDIESPWLELIPL
jgi:hypothetical protein